MAYSFVARRVTKAHDYAKHSILWDTPGTLAGKKAVNTATAHNNRIVINQIIKCCELLSKVMIYAFLKTHNLKVVGSNPTPATKEINGLDKFYKELKKLGAPWVP